MKMLRLFFLLTLLTAFSTSVFSQNTNQKPPTANAPVPFLGVAPNDNSELEEGLLIDGVYRGFGAEAAGLQRGDILLAINGDDVNSQRELTNELRAFKSGDEVELTFKRFNKAMKAKAKLADKPDYMTDLKLASRDEATGKKYGGKKAFMGIHPVTDWEKGGVRITGFTSKSQAWRAGLEEKDVITKLDDAAISTEEQLNNYLWEKAPGSEMKVAFLRDGKEKSLNMTLGETSANNSNSNYNYRNDNPCDDRKGDNSDGSDADGWASNMEEFGERMAEWGEKMGEEMGKMGEQFGAEIGEDAVRNAEELAARITERFSRERSGDRSFSNESFFSLRDFSASPNPTTGNLTISFSGRSNQEFSVVVVDENNQEIDREDRAELEEGLFTHQFDLTKQPAGTYYVRVWKGDDVITSQKIEKK